MILDTLENAARYAGLRTGLSEGFGFLDQPGIAELEPGRYEISDDLVFAIIEKNDGRKVEDGQLEAHRKYIDIQYIICGDESMGWSPRSELIGSQGYDEKRDLEFFTDPVQSIVKVPEGSFAVFMLSDAHLPGIGNGPIHKVVVKVAVD
ncbi:YhcH/YjgK/YiaL family protein [Pontiella agarivorans]|uniref:YhcH/YjgK/YiaL family protein n=1 Tax=Pontiella agarivorans TaxID=3038953 RepID=A0ABU5MXW1_9BACT|nr:YhcH/YjgK/YiaL family protein [Pontiella agarivorans]MDZ8119009.1 YhcH/YjgK/YiaL family protein [Pontiella agarivorans]